MNLVGIVNQITSTATLISHIFLILFLIFLLTRKRKALLGIVSQYSLQFSFIISLFAVVISLYYSEIANYVPCSLCWLQRIFIYPQALLFGIALWRKDRSIFIYALPLTIIGLIIGVYHVLVQLSPGLGNCSSTAVSCTTAYFLKFGYVSIPVMSLTAFVFLLVFALAGRRRNF